MKRILAILFMLPFMVAAQTLDLSTLNKEQKAQISKVLTAEAEQSPQAVAVTVRKEAEAWTTLGSNVGLALIGAAKEIGVAANDFAATDLGKVVTFIVVFKLIGESLIGVIVGTGIILVGGAIGTYMILKKNYKTIEYTYVPTWFGMRTKRVVSKAVPDTNENSGWAFAGVGLMAVSTIFGCLIIF